MHSIVENFLISTILPELEKGRPNWDAPHTKAVVHHIKNIISLSPQFNLDQDVLIIAAYAHDWGYAGLFSNDMALDYQQVSDSKEQHMIIGGAKVKHLLEDNIFSYLSLKQKQRIIHLVKIHDKLAELKDNDEFVLMEADTLGGLDVNFVKPTFNAQSNEKYMNEVKSKRISKFITDYGKTKAQELYKLRQEYYLKIKEV